MGKCEVCGQEMLTADGCYVSTVHINGKVYERIPYYGDFGEEDERCPDCNCKVGEYHHWGCDNEKCPVCHGQMLGCDCNDVYVIPRLTKQPKKAGK